MFSVNYARLVVGGVLLLFWGLAGGNVFCKTSYFKILYTPLSLPCWVTTTL